MSWFKTKYCYLSNKTSHSKVPIIIFFSTQYNMAVSSPWNRRFKGSFIKPTILAFITSTLIVFYILCTSRLLLHLHQTLIHVKAPLDSSNLKSSSLPKLRVFVDHHHNMPKEDDETVTLLLANISSLPLPEPFPIANEEIHLTKQEIQLGSSREKLVQKKNVFHDKDLFEEEYKEMNRTLKIYVYPHKKNDPFANVLLPVDHEPSGNYASESYFKKALYKSHFITNDPKEADLFYLPFSIASLRNDKRVGVGGIQDFVKNYVVEISEKYPYWNRSGGADHFYVACHSVGRSAMEKAIHVKLNAIQVVCSSSYFLSGYVAHKDASIPQIWPRKGVHPTNGPSQRKKLAFFAGAMNSRVRGNLVQVWKNDSEIIVHRGRMKTPYSDALLGSKYCIHAKGFEINTARIGDALYYGCVPVILADHYDLPYADILNWESFSVVVSSLDIPKLKKILEEIEYDQYMKLQKNVMQVQKHFQWNSFSKDFDVFHMIMYELWIRRSHLRQIY
ncbi:probable glycosyltransferase At5g03795 [Lycium barbarum]|uniref:probable glycosyltransferase At5g03795 n=1 Tax=Lycium barbarum TaxID=112863 RepID=UPI00293F76B7|nr:probable glycosyltransferase At5g03795 [Lycium barbarum]